MKSSCLSPGLKTCFVGVVLGVCLLASTAYVLGVTDSRPFCATCHIMLPAAVTHKMSTHMNLSCNDCHLPHNLWQKLPAKAATGLYDIYANTFKDVVLPLTTTPSMKDIINENCKACHAGTNMNVASMQAKPYCTDCHRNVPHQRTKPISTRMVAYE